MARHWLMVGYELEGGWDIPPPLANRFKTDGSVRVRGAYHQGEIATEPFDNLSRAEEALVYNYPQQLDESCGFHIHTSFALLDYSHLMSDEFYRHFLTRWEGWGIEEQIQRSDESRFWSRFRGENQFCRRFSGVDVSAAAWAQAMPDHRSESRYRQLNYCWRQHKTIECRMLPMFTTADGKPHPERAVRALREMLDIYDTFLDENPAEKTFDPFDIRPPDRPADVYRIAEEVKIPASEVISTTCEVNKSLPAPAAAGVIRTWRIGEAPDGAEQKHIAALVSGNLITQPISPRQRR